MKRNNYAVEVIRTAMALVNEQIREERKTLRDLEDLPDEKFDMAAYDAEEEIYFELLKKKEDLVRALYVI